MERKFLSNEDAANLSTAINSGGTEAFLFGQPLQAGGERVGVASKHSTFANCLTATARKLDRELGSEQGSDLAHGESVWFADLPRYSIIIKPESWT
jgi:hypothetical protein